MNKGASFFHHALKFRKDTCIGCSHCMNICPTRAIRIHGGKAELTDNRCVDCGKCYMVCPVGAIIVEQDDLSRIFEYEFRVALIPHVLLGQFPAEVTFSQICSVLVEMGFTHIYEVEHGAGILRTAILERMEAQGLKRPMISTFCPAIVRLVQVRFPGLTGNLVHLKTPLDIASMYYSKKLLDEGADPEKTGIFYITPCAAQIAAIKSPVGDEESAITGVINMNFIYNKIYTKVKQGFSSSKYCVLPAMQPLDAEDMLWSLTEGESRRMPGRVLAIDEMSNVIEFLEKMENEEISDIDYLELRACDQSCAGGILTSGNRFFTVERLRKRAKRAASGMLDSLPADEGKKITDYIAYLNENLPAEPIKPRSMDKLDEDMGRALAKMGQVREIMKDLPYVDCGLCGSPTCSSLAEDIVQGQADINQCIYIQKRKEFEGQLGCHESMQIMKRIWGEDKFRPREKNQK